MGELRKFIKDTRGAAMVEGAILAPVFITIFIGMYFLFQLYESKLEAGDNARSCAWHFAQENCDSVLPPECVEQTNNTAVSDEFRELTRKVSQDTQRLNSTDVSSELGSVTKAIEPVVDLLTGTLGIGQERIIKSSKDTNTPALFGGGTSSTQNNFAILCNEKPKTGLDVLISIWSAPWN